MRTISTLLLVSAAALAADAVEEFKKIKKNARIVYRDRGTVRAPRRPGPWRKAGRRLESRLDAKAGLQLRLRKAWLESGEELVLLVRWKDADKKRRATLLRRTWSSVRDEKSKRYQITFTLPAGAKRLKVEAISIVGPKRPVPGRLADARRDQRR